MCKAWDGAMQMYADEARAATRKEMKKEMKKEMRRQAREKDRRTVFNMFSRGYSQKEIAAISELPLKKVQKMCETTQDSVHEYLSYKYHNQEACLKNSSHFPGCPSFPVILTYSSTFSLPGIIPDEIPEAMDDGFGAVFSHVFLFPKTVLKNTAKRKLPGKKVFLKRENSGMTARSSCIWKESAISFVSTISQAVDFCWHVKLNLGQIMRCL